MRLIKKIVADEKKLRGVKYHFYLFFPRSSVSLGRRARSVSTQSLKLGFVKIHFPQAQSGRNIKD